MMRLHQGVPAFPLRGQDEAHLDAVQSGLLVRGECWGFHAVFLPHRASGVHRWSLCYYINKLDWFLPEPWDGHGLLALLLQNRKFTVIR